MSFLDKIKQQATDVATTVVDKTQETAKTGQAQIQLRNLKSEEKDALVALGRETHRLYQEGQLEGAKAADTLDSLVGSVNDVRSRISAKEEEMAAKSAVKIAFPVVLFIFPTLLVVLGGPAFILFLKSPLFASK